MIETGKIINGDCVEVMKTLPEGCIDLVVTSPPYGVGIAYDLGGATAKLGVMRDDADLQTIDAGISFSF